MSYRLVLAALLGLPLVCAALLAAVTYAWSTFTAEAAPAYAQSSERRGGLDTEMIPLSIGGVDYLVVSSFDRNHTIRADSADAEKVDSSYCQFITLYEFTRKSDKLVDLRFIGSRCVEWDKGFDLVNFTGEKGFLPGDFRKLRNR